MTVSKRAQSGAARTTRRGVTGDERRKQILETASQLFFEKGYRQTSLSDIANTLGITGPALYYYFRQKEQILFEIRIHIIDTAIVRIRSILEGDSPPDVKLRAILNDHITTLLKNAAPNVVFERERGHLGEEMEHTVRERERGYQELLTGLYVEGVERGLFREMPPRLAVGTLLAGCNWIYRYAASDPSRTTAEIVVQLEALLLHGAMVDSSEGKRRRAQSP